MIHSVRNGREMGKKRKVLLRNQQTNRFAKANGDWSSDEEHADDFGTPLEAINFCQLHRHFNTAVVIWSGTERFEVPIRCDD